jgi:hypothetical protein
MTSDSIRTGDDPRRLPADPRRLLADSRRLTQEVRLDRRVTWLPLLVLAGTLLLAAPVYRLGNVMHCHPDGSCQLTQQTPVIYWPLALAAAYAAIAYWYQRVARARGLSPRLLPYVVTGVAMVAVFLGAQWFGHHYLRVHPPAHPFSPLIMALDALVAPSGLIGLALLVLVWLERNFALLLFTVGYLAVVMTQGAYSWLGNHGPYWFLLAPLVINGAVLLLGAAGFAQAQRRGW